MDSGDTNGSKVGSCMALFYIHQVTM